MSSILDLDRETSSDKRRELMQEVSNLFVDGADAYNDRELVRFGEVLTLLLDQVPLEDRVDFSVKVAELANTPRDLALKLANDEARVAAPVLQHSPVLTDTDLVDIARRQGQDHLVAIARRDHLAPVVTDVLVDRGDARVLTTVARNAGAEFSQTGFSRMGEKAAGNLALAEALSHRSDIPADIAAQLIKLLPEAAQERLSQVVSRGGEDVDALIAAARRELEGSRSEQRRQRIEAKVLLADVRDGRLTADQAVDKLVLTKRMADLTYLMAELAGVGEAHVGNVLHKVNAMGIAVICRALDISEPVFERLSRLRCERLRLNGAQAEGMIREYAGLDKASAERALRFHKVRSAVRA